jgi:hypothetical protein
MSAPPSSTKRTDDVARHNREGEGEDQRGFTYQVSYQPDWLRHVKVSRTLPNGRQSTKTLFRNPHECRVRSPGTRVRTRITCPEQGVDVEVVVQCQQKAVQRVTVACRVPGPHDSARRVEDADEVEEIAFILENGLPPAR